MTSAFPHTLHKTHQVYQNPITVISPLISAMAPRLSPRFCPCLSCVFSQYQPVIIEHRTPLVKPITASHSTERKNQTPLRWPLCPEQWASLTHSASTASPHSPSNVTSPCLECSIPGTCPVRPSPSSHLYHMAPLWQYLSDHTALKCNFCSACPSSLFPVLILLHSTYHHVTLHTFT